MDINGQDLTNYTSRIESLRKSTDKNSEFSHVSEQIFLDHAANGIYMSSLVKDYYNKLTNTTEQDNQNGLQETWSLFSNPHSHSQSGLYTNMYIELTRNKVLSLFNTNQNEYDVVFVMNATHGLKLLAECFDFEQNSSCFAYLNDNHTSVVGMREIISESNSNTSVYCLFEADDLSSTAFNSACSFDAKLVKLNKNRNTTELNNNSRNLFVYPAQSNFNGRKYSLELIDCIQKHGINLNILNEQNEPARKEEIKNNWFTCLDTASFVCSSKLDLSVHKPEFMVISFYKIFGFPTGIGALLIKKNERVRNCLNKKKYFGGGTVSMALIDEDRVCMKNSSFHEFLEDGTISYLQIIGVRLAIDKMEKLTLNKGIQLIQSYVEHLTNYCVDGLSGLKHFNGQSLVEIYRREINSSIKTNHGPIISFNLKKSNGDYIGFTLVDKLAQENKINLRTGCFCNIGACQMFMQHLKDKRSFVDNYELYGHKCGDHIDLINGKPTGAIRISFGYCTIKQEIDTFMEFLKANFMETKQEVDRNDSANSNGIIRMEKQYFKITHIFIYPIKSCAPMKIEKEWPIQNDNKTGFLYDRNWAIVDNNHIPLTQKRLPALTRLTPFIDLNRNKFCLYFENEAFEMELESNEKLKSTSQSVFINSNSIHGYDQGDLVADWLTNVFKLKETCRLIRVADETEANVSKNKSSFVNKADYLLVNGNSVKMLREYLEEDLSPDSTLKTQSFNKLVDEFLVLQFRPNLVISTESNGLNESKFDEEFWTRVKLLNKNIEFKIVDNCTRCQMVNINQSTARKSEKSNTEDSIEIKKMLNSLDTSKYCSALLKQLYKLKSNSKFGIYLSKIESETSVINDQLDSEVNNIIKEVNRNMFIRNNSQVSVGDIGIAYIETSSS